MEKTFLLAIILFSSAVFAAQLAPVYQVTYYRYSDQACSSLIETVNIVQGTCNPEYSNSSRGIINVNSATSLTSCDYTDTLCNVQRECLQYNSNQCYNYADGSSKYVITKVAVPTNYEVVFYDYSDLNCQVPTVISKIIQNSCNPEYNGTTGGFITVQTESRVLSCDYSDNQCATNERCVQYNAGQCYQFADGTSQMYTVRPSNTNIASYRNYTDQYCQVPAAGDVLDYWLLDSCNPEYGNSGRAGILTYLNSTAIKSCDYSDLRCSKLLYCVTLLSGECNTVGNSRSRSTRGSGSTQLSSSQIQAVPTQDISRNSASGLTASIAIIFAVLLISL